VIKLFSAVILALLASATAAVAQRGQAIDLPGRRSLLMRPKAPQASLILMPGDAGAIGVTSEGVLTRAKGNSLVRISGDFLKRTLAVLIVDADTDLRAAIDYRAAIKRPVIVAGTSRGRRRTASPGARGRTGWFSRQASCPPNRAIRARM
jgi:hypothetical protein